MQTQTRQQRLEDHLSALRRELQEIRSESLTATRTGDYMKVARCTAKAARTNRAIMDVEAQLASC